MKKKIAAKVPGRPKKEVVKEKISATVDPEILRLANEDAERQGVSLSHVVERCLKCLLTVECDKPVK